jgi:hypothetical protein
MWRGSRAAFWLNLKQSLDYTDPRVLITNVKPSSKKTAIDSLYA